MHMCKFKHSNSAKDLTRLVFGGTEVDLKKKGHNGTPAGEAY